MAIALAKENEEGREQRELADVRPDPRPELVTAAGKDVLEVGLEPAWHSGEG